MPKPIRALAVMTAAVCSSALAADMPPLQQGIYVPATRPCKGASNAEIFTVLDKCADIRGGGEIADGPTVVTIANPGGFARSGEAYRHCGTTCGLEDVVMARG